MWGMLSISYVIWDIMLGTAGVSWRAYVGDSWGRLGGLTLSRVSIRCAYNGLLTITQRKAESLWLQQLIIRYLETNLMTTLPSVLRHLLDNGAGRTETLSKGEFLVKCSRHGIAIFYSLFKVNFTVLRPCRCDGNLPELHASQYGWGEYSRLSRRTSLNPSHIFSMTRTIANEI